MVPLATPVTATLNVTGWFVVVVAGVIVSVVMPIGSTGESFTKNGMGPVLAKGVEKVPGVVGQLVSVVFPTK